MKSRTTIKFALAALAFVSASCLRTDFDPASVVTSVRIFASRADKPYAKPGERVELELLAYDGRADKAREMKIYWIPTPCINPPRDLYYVCFAAFAAAAQSSAAAASATLPLSPGTDLTDLLPQGPRFSFVVPQTIISTHPPTPGASEPYGLAIVFNMACAGRVKIDPPSANPQAVPLGCYDDAGNRLGADDYVLGFTRVYAYADRANQNPTLDAIVFDGKPVGDEGITLDRCTKEKLDECDKKSISVGVPDASWELNPQALDESGNAQREQIWVTFYSTQGRFDHQLALLFDPGSGRVADLDNKFQPPKEAGTGFLWAVVHDNRGGAAWRQVPLTIR